MRITGVIHGIAARVSPPLTRSILCCASFLDVKKGASEDHAILQCNLFLGLGLDAYLAIGRLPGGVQQHVWVMTREPNGDIKFWETTKGEFYTLPGRWMGLYLDGTFEVAKAAQANASAGAAATERTDGALTAKKAPSKKKEEKCTPQRLAPRCHLSSLIAHRCSCELLLLSLTCDLLFPDLGLSVLPSRSLPPPSSPHPRRYGGMEAMDTMDKRKMRAQLALAQDKAAREAERKAQEAAAAQKREEKLLYLAHEEQWTADQQLNPFETPRDFTEQGGCAPVWLDQLDSGYYDRLPPCLPCSLCFHASCAPMPPAHPPRRPSLLPQAPSSDDGGGGALY